jgi:hypothetical protein
MTRKILPTLLLIGLSAPAAAQTVTAEKFMVRTTADLVALCAPAPSDPLAVQAIHFCHGYLIGAFQHHLAENAGRPDQSICLPNPPPDRNAAVAQFVGWARANPQYMGELPVETEFRFIEATWPCRR